MKRCHTLFSALLAVYGIFAITACAGKAPVLNDLANRRFVLVSVDGQACKKASRLPDLAFLEDFRVAGSVCNRFTGQGELAGATLTVRQMISTKMFCPDAALNDLETRLAGMLRDGAEIALDGDALTLRQGGHVLVYNAVAGQGR